MSLMRLVVWSCLIGGWSAFLGWLIAEVPFHAWIDEDSKLAVFLSILMATLVAVTIGGGVSMASGLTTPQMSILIKRLLLGFLGGLLGGLLGSLIGSGCFAMLQNVPLVGFFTRVFGWTLTGLAIGAGEGIFDRDMKKIRNGVIGGAIGGFLAGFLFVPISYVLNPMSGRAFAFVLLGLFIGLFIGLAQVILKEAWLTVEDGFRTGRQLILGKDVITMGTSEKASLIFIAYGAKGVEPIHLKITKQEDGAYQLEDNQSRTGTLLNGQPVKAPTRLLNGDLIQFGVNVVRFNEGAQRQQAERLPDPKAPKPLPAVPAGAIEAPKPPSPIQPAPAVKPPAAIQPPPKPTPPPPAPKPAAPVAATPPKPAPKPPAAPAKPQEGRCPICDKKVVGIPGERRCAACFTSF
jgi:hypothetical protein